MQAKLATPRTESVRKPAGRLGGSGERIAAEATRRDRGMWRAAVPVGGALLNVAMARVGGTRSRRPTRPLAIGLSGARAPWHKKPCAGSANHVGKGLLFCGPRALSRDAG
jgi:hypothetical protein